LGRSGHDAEQTGEQRRDQDADDTEGDGVRQRVEDGAEHRATTTERFAEVAPQQVSEKDDVLLGDRFVRAELLPGQLEDRFGSARPVHDPRRVPGH